MIILGAIVSIVLLVVIIRFALSPQTDRLVKRAALVALGAIALAIVACLVMVLAGPKKAEEEAVFSGLTPAEPVAAVVDPGRIYMLVLGGILLLFVGIVILLSLREEKKKRSGQGGVKRPG
jgi:formate hydrogenlyase subunit 3/multisubunit Na+/H+ antiporter MnhD subunit